MTIMPPREVGDGRRLTKGEPDRRLGGGNHQTPDGQKHQTEAELCRSRDSDGAANGQMSSGQSSAERQAAATSALRDAGK